MAAKIEPPAPPYVGPAKWHGGNTNKPILRIDVHCTAGAEPDVDRAARSTAAYTKATSRPSSWHYCADARESVQLVYDSVIAYHDGTNSHSIGYELCCSLSNSGGIVRKATAGVKALGHWQLRSHKAMLRIAAEDIARLCLVNDIPIRRLTVAQIRRGEKGLCGHVDMRDAFPGSTSHWDPGPFFPWRRFLDMVRAAARRLEREATRLETVDYEIASINLGAGTDADKLADLELLVAEGAHAIGVQEAGDRHPMLHEFLAAHPLWAMFMRTVSGGGKVPILYDTTVFELDADFARVIEAWAGGEVGPVGAGPSELDPKALAHAPFTHLPSGRRVHLLNHHVIASHASRLHKGRLIPKAERIKRAAVAAQQADAFERESELCHGIVHGTGDWNASKKWVEDHVDGYVVDNNRPTFRRSQYDHVGHFPDPNVTVVDQVALETSGSRKNKDHRAAMVTYRTTIKEH